MRSHVISALFLIAYSLSFLALSLVIGVLYVALFDYNKVTLMLGGMFKLVLLIGGILTAYALYNNPSTIDQPIYAEMRIDLTAQGREINTVLFAKMVDQDDCEQRADKVWREVMHKCDICSFKETQCKTQLNQRYMSLFEDARINTTYISFNRSNRFERDGRMVMWGLNHQEAQEACKIVKSSAKGKYRGDIRCIVADS